MSDGCPGCFLSAKGQAIELERVQKQAKQYAKANSTTVAIYKEAGEIRFIAADLAAGLPVVGYISQFDRDPARPVD